MPLYEYQCDACGRRFERIQKFSDPPVTECPECGGAVRKLLSSPAIQFKGSGFYITDYARSGSTSESGKGEKKPADAGAPSSTSSTESSKPAASSDSGSSGSAKKAEPTKA